MAGRSIGHRSVSASSGSTLVLSSAAVTTTGLMSGLFTVRGTRGSTTEASVIRGRNPGRHRSRPTGPAPSPPDRLVATPLSSRSTSATPTAPPVTPDGGCHQPVCFLPCAGVGSVSSSNAAAGRTSPASSSIVHPAPPKLMRGAVADSIWLPKTVGLRLE